VFVPDTAPGDRVRVTLEASRKRWQRATLREVLEPGADRQPPSCPVSEVCGGCQWHHVRYEAQLAAKQTQLERAFRQARIPTTPLEPIAAPSPLAYRGRARLHWRATDEGAQLGFHGRRSHALVNREHCPVLLPGLDGLLGPLHGALAGRRGEGELLLLGNEQGQQALALYGTSSKGLARQIGESLGDRLRGALVRPTPDARQADRHGEPELDQEAPGEPPFWTTPETFFQASPAANRLLRARLDEWVGDEDGPVLELYAGSGNLTRDLARSRPVIAVESQPAAVVLARRNLEGRDVKLRRADATRAVAELNAEGLRPSLVVLDPPRAGARDVARALPSLGAPRILYVSCDPMTLARDVAELASAGYALRRVGLLDTMPQTFHFETVAELALP
jgi:23S rRNA (uracil1939-C5)-methyltransferase